MDRTLVERVREVEELYSLIGDTAKGEGAVALIEGTAGVGKSSLLAQARARAERDGARVLTARGSELESLFTFGVVRQLFEGVLADKKGRAGALKGAAAPAEAAFGPPADEGEPGGSESFTTLHGLYWLALNLAEKQPLVLAIDDLHWCDRASLSFIAYLAGRLEGQPILVATTLRSTDPGVDPALVADIAHSPSTRAVRPGPLSPDAVAELVRERLGPNAEPEFCTACHSATGGNPLLLGQLLTALEGDSVKPDAQSAGAVRDIGPRAVSRGVLLRLARLPGPAVEVARAVAVMGDGADLATITAFTGLDEATVAATSGDLARAEILAPDTPLSFVHPLVRDAVYEELSPAERELQHARAVEVMVAAGTRRRSRGGAPAADGQARRPAGRGPAGGGRPRRRRPGSGRGRGGVPAPGPGRARARPSSGPSCCWSWARPRRWPAEPRRSSTCRPPTSSWTTRPSASPPRRCWPSR